MTNGEKYKKAFSVLQTSKGSLQEVENMAKLQKRTKMKTAAAVIAGCIILGGTGTAYAANVGGIQRTVQIWLHGDQTQATLDVSNDGTYTMEYYNEDGSRPVAVEYLLMLTELSAPLQRKNLWKKLIPRM